MTWLVNEEIDREMYRLSRAICEGNTGEAATRHREICKQYTDAPRPVMPKNTEKDRHIAASEARRIAGREASARNFKAIVDSNLDMFTSANIADIIGSTRKLAASRLRDWTERGFVERMEHGKEWIYRITEKGRSQ